MSAPRYSSSAATTLADALTPADAHAWCITNTDTGQIKGVYTRYMSALDALLKLGAGLFVLTIVHPARCDCPEVAA